MSLPTQLKSRLGAIRKRHRASERATGDPMLLGVRMRTQAWIVALVLLLPSAYLGFEYYRLQQHNIDFAQKERAGIAYLRSSLDLFRLTQDRRYTLVDTQVAAASANAGAGAVAVASAGVAEPVRRAQDDAITSAFARLAELDAAHGEGLLTTPLFDQLRSQRDVLTSKTQASPPEQLEIHTRYINLLRNLMVQAVDGSNLALDPSFDSNSLVDLAAIRQPEVIDIIYRLMVINSQRRHATGARGGYERLLASAIGVLDHQVEQMRMSFDKIQLADPGLVAETGLAALVKQTSAMAQDMQLMVVAAAMPNDMIGEGAAMLKLADQHFTANSKLLSALDVALAKRVDQLMWARNIAVLAVLMFAALAAVAVVFAYRVMRALRRARRNAELATEAKGRFLANMSHELRTPMNAVLGMLTLLGRTALEPRQRDYVDKSEGAAKSLMALLNDILDFSKAESGKMTLDVQPFRVDRLMRDVGVILAANLRNKPIEILYDIAPDIPKTLLGDALRLQQILVNLAGNAVKFTAQGEVVIRLSVASRKAGLTGDVLGLQMEVKDTGIGIAREHQARIFEGFAQAETSTTRRFGGTGLGLSITKMLVELMGGRLQLESEPGKGSRFYFVVDVGVDESPAALAQDAKLKPENLRKLKVLVVDDNPLARDIMTEMVRALGWEVDAANSGTQALAAVKARRDQGQPAHDVMFVDWQMPGLDGWATCLKIREITQGVPEAKAPLLVIVTAHGREALLERPAEEQTLVDDVLLKPLTASMLFDAVVNARMARVAQKSPGASEGKKAGAVVTGEQSDQPVLANANASAARAPRSKSRLAAGQRLSGLRLLVVEDNAINQQIARELLLAEGAQVLLADNGATGLQAVRASFKGEGPKIDLVLMDMQMPVMDGLEAARAIRAEFGGEAPPNWNAVGNPEASVSAINVYLPIVAMTANAMPTDRQACLAAGMNEHIGKPFAIDQLVALVQRLMRARDPGATLDSGFSALVASNWWQESNEAALQGAGSAVLAGSAKSTPIVEFVEVPGRSEAAEAVEPVASAASAEPADLALGAAEARSGVFFQTLGPSRQAIDLSLDEAGPGGRAPASNDANEAETSAKPAAKSAEEFATEIGADIDMKGALHRMGGNTELYMRTLGQFTSDLARLPVQLHSLLRKNNPDEARNMVHSVKGLAATLGDNALSAVAARVEKALKESQPSSSAAPLQLPSGLYQEFEEATQRSIDALTQVRKHLVATTQKAQKPARSATSAAIDHAAFEADLRELQALLANSDMAAMAQYEKIKTTGLKLAPQRFKRLDAAMAALDFAAAARCCDEMLT